MLSIATPFALGFPERAPLFASTAEPPPTTCDEPPATYTGPVDYTITTNTPCDGSTCYNRYSPDIPLAMTVPSGSVITYETADLWDGNWPDYSDMPDVDANFAKVYGDIAKVHIVTGPVGIAGAMPGDKLAVEILDIVPRGPAFTFSDSGLGFLDDIPDYRDWVWWKMEDGVWKSPKLPNVEIPYEPFPGSIGVLPSKETVEMKLAHHANETAIYGGPAWPINPTQAIPQSVCGEGGSAPEYCLRTMAGGDFFGNTDTQRMGIGTTLFLTCQVAGCGLGMGDIHGAQGDGELSITAIEMPAAVTVKLTLIKEGDKGFSTPTPSMYGGSSIKRMSPPEWISFMGFPFKEAGEVPSQYRGLPADLYKGHKLIPESMSLASRNALMKAVEFFMEVGGYDFGMAMIVASVSVDIRVAQLVDKPAVGMEAIVDLSIFKGDLYDKFKAAANPLA